MTRWYGYRNEDDFVRGQKLKILIALATFAFLAIRHALTGAPIFR